MKTRNGFVSNSSSSSFIVIGDSGLRERIPEYCIKDGVLVLGDKVGETEFGWGPCMLDGIMDRLNLCVVVAQYAPDPSFSLSRFQKVVQERQPEITKITFESSYSCVDHQSIDALQEMYGSDEDLDRFIFDPESCIELNNDNY